MLLILGWFSLLFSCSCRVCPAIEDILAIQQIVPVEIETDLAGLASLGFLDQREGSVDLIRGNKLGMPYWCVEGFMSNQARSYVQVDIPNTF